MRTIDYWDNLIKNEQLDTASTAYIQQVIKNSSNTNQAVKSFLENKRDEEQKASNDFLKNEKLLEQRVVDELSKKDFIVTSLDLNREYEVLSPIIFNTTNRGIFNSHYIQLDSKYRQKKYKDILVTSKMSYSSEYGFDGLALLTLIDFNPFGFEGNVGHRQFDRAFYISLAEMKIRAKMMGGDAIIGLKADFDLDTQNFGAFYLQMFGTVVKFK